MRPRGTSPLENSSFVRNGRELKSPLERGGRNEPVARGGRGVLSGEELLRIYLFFKIAKTHHLQIPIIFFMFLWNSLNKIASKLSVQ